MINDLHCGSGARSTGCNNRKAAAPPDRNFASPLRLAKYAGSRVASLTSPVIGELDWVAVDLGSLHCSTLPSRVWLLPQVRVSKVTTYQGPQLKHAPCLTHFSICLCIDVPRLQYVLKGSKTNSHEEVHILAAMTFTQPPHTGRHYHLGWSMIEHSASSCRRTFTVPDTSAFAWISVAGVITHSQRVVYRPLLVADALPLLLHMSAHDRSMTIKSVAIGLSFHCDSIEYNCQLTSSAFQRLKSRGEVQQELLLLPQYDELNSQKRAQYLLIRETHLGRAQKDNDYADDTRTRTRNRWDSRVQ